MSGCDLLIVGAAANAATHPAVIFLDKTDTMSSPMKAKGVGATVANAVYNATGVRGGTIRLSWTNCWRVCRRWLSHCRLAQKSGLYLRGWDFLH